MRVCRWQVCFLSLFSPLSYLTPSVLVYENPLTRPRRRQAIEAQLSLSFRLRAFHLRLTTPDDKPSRCAVPRSDSLAPLSLLVLSLSSFLSQPNYNTFAINAVNTHTDLLDSCLNLCNLPHLWGV